MVWGLLGRRCEIYTDNNKLSYLATARLETTEQWWAVQLTIFDYEIRYYKNTDSLSQQYLSVSLKEQAAPGTPIPESLQRVASGNPLLR